ISIASGEIHGSGDQVAIADVGLFDGTYGNTLFMGTACSGDPGCGLSGAILKPEEAWNIDTKLDDGKPATGFVRSYEAEGGTSASN
ncbi:hypothetical protein, partial [Salmonella sp. M132]|uniref:hypothetical protein n=1 Tax=Salmonella sp. M132 TaxID=3240287 RepID=UPI00352B2778